MKKVSLIVLSLLVLSQLLIVNASAIDYKTQFIESMSQKGIFWSGSTGGNFYYMDLNSDNKLELLFTYYYSDSAATEIYYNDNGKIKKYYIGNDKSNSNTLITGIFNYYYDSASNKYRVFGRERTYNTSSAYYRDYELNINGNRVYKIYHSPWSSLTKVEVNFYQISTVSWQNYNNSQKKNSLEKSYSMFKYKNVIANKYPTVNAHATNNGAQITWDKISGVPKYRVYKKVNGSWQKVGDSTGSSYVDKSAKAGNTYVYTVRGITSDAKQFMTDYNKNGKTLKFLSTPQISKMEIVSGGVKLTWNKLSGAGKYRVYYKSNGTGSWQNLGDVTENSASLYCYGSGNKFTYTIRAISADGKQFFSGYNTSGKTIKYVYDPKITSISNTSKGVKIAYTKPAGTEKFRVYRKTAGGSWGKIADTTATSYTDGSAKNGTRYYYTVRCISSTGKSFQSYYDTAGKSIVCKK